ncbi:DNA topoisomerase 2-binding protein 1-A-like isoform X2 [Argiope bruennichi]|nr:DNA topoisomerase 2-binding protein 1-A-like isoform X2 [Argiope bruennichi]
MMPEWVEEVWETGQHQLIHASDKVYDKYKCPVFRGLVITVSQLTVSERSSIQSLVEENGGSYLAPLKANQTTHLVLTEPTGDKYRYAKNWKIFCVNINWIYDSVKSGYCQDENLYKIDDSSSQYCQLKRSTPNRDMTSNELPLVDCSAITNVSIITHLDETVRSDTSIVVNRKNSWTSALESFDLSSLPKYGQFLDGCKIFLTGFNSIQLDKLRKIINAGGGMRFNTYSESISHVVCGHLTEEFLQSLKASSLKPYIVNLKWLLECCKNEKLMDEKSFLCMDSTLLSPEKDIPEIKPISMSQASKSFPRKDDATCDILTDILKQYVGKEDSDDTDANKSRVSKKSVEKDGQQSKAEFRSTAYKALMNDKDVNIVDLADEDESTSSSVQLFAGLKFIVVGFGEKDSGILAKMIEDHSGSVYINDPAFEADIAVVPIIWQDLSCHAANVITNCWLQKCIEDSRIYDFDENELFKPVVIPPGKRPFESFVISVSQYSGTERDCLMHLAEVLGATCQEYFVRKANRSRGILSNTHLIVATPEGSKYEASKKWKIPAVKKQWVLNAAKSGSIPPVEKYLVDNPPLLQINEDIHETSITGKENINCNDIHQGCIELPVLQAGQSPSKSCRGRIEKPITVCSSHVEEQDMPDLIETRQNLSKCLEKSISDCTENRMGNQNMPIKDEFHSIDSKSRQNIAENSNNDCNMNLKENLSTSKLDKNIGLEFAKPFDMINTSTPQRNVMELNCENKKGVSPMLSKTETTFNESLNLDQSYKHKFQVSDLLKDLDTSASQEHSFTASAKRKSLPVEELFGRNLASAIRGVNNKILFPSDGKLDFDKNSFIESEPKSSDTSNVMKGVILCVAKKLSSIQNELTEIVVSLGGSYLWSYDNSCTHFVFTGKVNDLARDFREARSNGKKIVCPEWVYACRDKNALVDEELYPHTLKISMSLTDEIAIVKSSSAKDDKLSTQIKDVNPPVSAADFNQQLNDLLVAAKSAKKRHSKRQFNSVSSSPNQEAGTLLKLQQKHISDSFIKPIHQEEIGTEEQDTGSQSQSYPVVWDDPTGRLERERIAALAAASESKRNCENVVNSSTNFNNVGCSKRISTSSDIKKSPLDEVFTKSRETSCYPDIRKFMFTNIPEPKKIRFVEIIQELGGEVSDEKAFDITATHLILEKPIKNEKLLSSVASGKWILHPQYLTICEDKKEFVPEEDFEWGGPFTEEFLQNLPNSARKIAFCPHRWRAKLNKQTNLKGAFHNWVVLIIADDKTKQSTYTKILEAGGAQVISSNQESDRLTHVIVDMKKRSLSQVDLSSYVSNKIRCVKPEYLAFYLIEDPEPDIENFLIPEVKDLSSSEQSSKRRNLSIATRGSKRTRMS